MAKTKVTLTTVYPPGCPIRNDIDRQTPNLTLAFAEASDLVKYHGARATVKLHLDYMEEPIVFTDEFEDLFNDAVALEREIGRACHDDIVNKTGRDSSWYVDTAKRIHARMGDFENRITKVMPNGQSHPKDWWNFYRVL